ncbi:Zn(II)2Cys6 transcription factor [Aspergillus mulundensis]|uniref:Zn(2)-C6 fungal-type domain-containing protein n=1 Tax=Aspergillus mulundensis TaxID=1810919 RepID=A0A3D8T2E3_9EURO|nr:hypothetical protein DSM5745_00022 [Aspergillus mulundensis]RDW92700.1 hypothetical protein DSM5745_00022 [Aspergillus mulundensis]
MPARRPHTKSRAGCQRCKEKHVKCDEVRPTCGACARYGVPCLPKPLKTLRRARSALPESHTSVAASPAPSLATPRERSSLSLWEFQLLHHWIIHVTESFDVSPGFRRAWADRGVQLAIEHDFFLHMILMLAALHLGLTKSPSFTEAHRAFILGGCSQATARFRQEAENVSDSNCHVVHAFPYLMSIYALALPQFDREEKGVDAVLDEMIHILLVIKGNAHVKDTCSPQTRAQVSLRYGSDARALGSTALDRLVKRSPGHPRHQSADSPAVPQSPRGPPEAESEAACMAECDPEQLHRLAQAAEPDGDGDLGSLRRRPWVLQLAVVVLKLGRATGVCDCGDAAGEIPTGNCLSIEGVECEE